VSEFGPVTFPAYAKATAKVRSVTDEFTLAPDDPEAVAAFRAWRAGRGRAWHSVPALATGGVSFSAPAVVSAAAAADQGTTTFTLPALPGGGAGPARSGNGQGGHDAQPGNGQASPTDPVVRARVLSLLAPPPAALHVDDKE
jgi:hypothetical protein